MESTASDAYIVGSLYVIKDVPAENIVGGIQLHRADAVAVRTFGDIARQPDTTVAQHTADFELLKIGHLMSNHTVDAFAQPMVIITGEQWKAAQEATRG